MTGWSRPFACMVCGIGIFLLALTTALGYSKFSGFVPFAEGSAWLDLWDFIVSTNLLPLGSLVVVLFCCNRRYGWGWEAFKAEANEGKGLKVKDWMRPFFSYVIPAVILLLYLYGLFTYNWR